MAAAKAKVVETIEVEPLKVGSVTVWLRGRTPIICNRMPAKAWRELLCPNGRKGKAEREQTLKHDPLNEFHNSMTKRVGSGPTRIQFPLSAVKGALGNAAVETKGTSRAQIGRLVVVPGEFCDLYGIPQVHMAIVRSADMNKTPDVRTRAIFSEWCTKVTIQFVKPQLSEKTVFQLLSNSGIIIGIGDFRQEKGKGNYGQYEVVTEEECKDIIKNGGREAQDRALANPMCYDSHAEELLGWFQTTVVERGKSEMLAARNVVTHKPSSNGELRRPGKGRKAVAAAT